MIIITEYYSFTDCKCMYNLSLACFCNAQYMNCISGEKYSLQTIYILFRTLHITKVVEVRIFLKQNQNVIQPCISAIYSAVKQQMK